MEAAFLKPMIGLTRFLFLMNFREKSGVLTNVHTGFCLFKKDGDFRGLSKLFVLHGKKAFFQGATLPARCADCLVILMGIPGNRAKPGSGEAA